MHLDVSRFKERKKEIAAQNVIKKINNEMYIQE